METSELVHVVFIINDSVLLIENKKGQLGFPSSKLKELDAYSSSYAAGRIVQKKCASSDIRKLSINKNYDKLVDWNLVEQNKEQCEQLKNPMTEFQLSPQLFIWQEYFQDCPIWNDDNDRHFAYISQLQESDLPQLEFKFQQVSLNDLSGKQLKQKTLSALQELNLVDVIRQKTYLEFKQGNFIFIGFKLPGYDKFQPPKPYLPTSSIFHGLYRRKQERWYRFNAPGFEFPDDELLKETKAILMCGSPISVYDQTHEKWIKLTQSKIFNAYTNHPNLKILGICFGLQICVEAFGGKVDAMEKKKLDKNFFLFGNEILHINVDLLKQFKAFEGFNFKETVIINQAHGDEAIIVPELFTNVAFSENCKNEMLISKDGRVLAFQGHPEYASQQQLAFGSLFRSIISKKPQEEVIEIMKPHFVQPNDRINAKLCLTFIKN